jgi:hypothetical protein
MTGYTKPGPAMEVVADRHKTQQYYFRNSHHYLDIIAPPQISKRHQKPEIDEDFCRFLHAI